MIYERIIIDNNSEDFIERIMNENLWTREYALRVIEEYKKFIYLTTRSNAAPSYEIDQVWHAHMLFSEDYTKMCADLGKEYIHHRPTGKEQKITNKKHGVDEYAMTKLNYISTFLSEPPIDIWTNWKPMCNVYIDLNNHWVIPVNDYKGLIKSLFQYIKQKINGIL